MKRPELRLENYDTVYDYYQERGPNERFAKLGHFVFSLMYQPQVSYSLGVQEQIEEHLQSDGRLIIASNHVNDQDQFVIGAMMRREDSLHPMVGNTIIPGKESLFHNWFLRRALDGIGAIPTFRTRDTQKLATADKADVRRNQLNATKRLVETCVSHIDDGRHMAIFPEGTRNAEEPTKVQELKTGIGRIVCAAAAESNAAIMPMGIAYSENRKKRPSVHVESLMHGPFGSHEELMTSLHPRIQSAVDRATLYASV